MNVRAPGIGISERVYAALWVIYPAAFRREYGSDALELFRDRYRETHAARGTWGVLLLWLRTVPNVLVHGTLERLGAMRSAWAGGQAARAFGSAARTLARSPLLSGTIVLTLAIGIGSTVALFSIVRGVLLRPLPFDDPARLVTISESNPTLGGAPVGPSPLNFVDWEGTVPALESMSSWWLTSGTHRTEDAAEEVRTAQVTPDFFQMLGATPLLGRTFVRDEVVGHGPIVLSHRLWQRLYGGDPGVVGGSVQVSGETYQVVGVMPPDFRFPDPTVEAWLAWDMAAVYATRPQARSWRFLEGAGRLAPGATLEEAERQLRARTEALARIHPEANRGWIARLTSLHDELVGDVRATLWVAFGAVSFLLLIACANVANLLLARVPARSRELAIRASMGASRGTMLGTLAAESILLTALGGVLGLGLGSLLLELVVSLESGRIPRLEEVAIDGWVLTFAITVSAACCVLFGLAPALQALRGSSFGSLRDGRRASATREQRGIREAFVAAQLAIAVVMLTGAALFRTSFARITQVDPGFDAENVAAFRMSLAPGEDADRYYRALIDDLLALPGVVAAGASQTLPLDPVAGDFERPYRAVGASTTVAEAPVAAMRVVTPGYVDAMGMRLLDGTDFSGAEGASDPRVALVNRTLARRLWPDRPAVGETFELEWQGGWGPYRVVGVVEDILHDGPRGARQEEVFVSHRQIPYLPMSVVVRSASDPALLIPAMRLVVDTQDERQPAYHFVTLDELRGAAVAEERFLKVLLELFSAIALVLASGGVYGVIAYTVSHRRREIGVRMALGARPRSVVAEVFGRAVLVAGIGAATGLTVVQLVGGALDRVLFGIAASDPMPSLAGLGVVIATAALAAWVPARRAAQIPPSVALASE